MEHIHHKKNRVRFVKVQVCSIEDGGPISEHDCIVNEKMFSGVDKPPVGVMAGRTCIGRVARLEYDDRSSVLSAVIETTAEALKMGLDLDCKADWIKKPNYDHLVLGMLTVVPKR
jgi:hypothetical protein